MKYNETTAYQCRYGEVAERIWGTSEILWEQSYADYQGEAAILALMPDGQLCFYEWTYGSCSGCDGWEAAGLSDEEIEQEMRDSSVYFGTFDELLEFFKLPEQDFQDAIEVMQKMRGLEAHRYYFAREAVLKFIEQGGG